MVREAAGRLLTALYFWVVVGVVMSLSIFGYAYASNQAETSRSALLVERQREVIAYLCERDRVIDVTFVQLAATERELARLVSPQTREVLQKRAALYRTIHEEFSDTRVCQEVE